MLRCRVINEEIIMGEVGSAVLISVGGKHRKWQNAVKGRKAMSKSDACDE
jgi:hypothetical protein